MAETTTETCEHPVPMDDDSQVEVLEPWAEVGPVHELAAEREGTEPLVPEPEHQLVVEARTVRCPECGDAVGQERIVGEEG